MVGVWESFVVLLFGYVFVIMFVYRLFIGFEIIICFWNILKSFVEGNDMFFIWVGVGFGYLRLWEMNNYEILGNSFDFKMVDV